MSENKNKPPNELCELSEHNLLNVREGIYRCLKCWFTVDISDAHQNEIDSSGDINEHTWDALVESGVDEK